VTVFISYARKDASAVDVLARDIERAKRNVWIDRELTGGQSWWDTILGQIRGCSLFLFVLSPDSLKSKACQAELRYASDLARPILPVIVRDVAIQLAPHQLSNAQMVDYRERTPEAVIDLVNALAAPLPGPLPAVLPEPPPVPMSYLNPFREQVQAESLSFQQQSVLLVDLKAHLRDEDERAVSVQLLRELRARPDISYAVAKEIDVVLADPTAAAPDGAASESSSGPATGTASGESTSSSQTAPPGWYADPTGQFELRYWDGTAWTDHGAKRSGR
jgi:TIR domain/Protein of unknown function (DUF2510)